MFNLGLGKAGFLEMMDGEEGIAEWDTVLRFLALPQWIARFLARFSGDKRI
jgi:hypothetical protein